MNDFKNIHLDKNSTQYLYIQLYNKLKSMIINGEIKPHTKLPPIRKLSNFLNVNNVTVVNAYKLLEKENLVYKKIGSGTFISDIFKNDERFLVDNETNLSEYGIHTSYIQHTYQNNKYIDFSAGIPTSDLFPVSDFKKAINEVLDRDKGNAFGYHEAQGYYSLREAIKNYVSKHNIFTDTDNIQIISGAQQGIDILSKTLIDYGDIVFIESPTYPGAIASFKSRSARIVEIPIMEDGINIKDLENKLKVFSPKFIYVMPNFQNPTGFTYSDEKKYKLLELSAKNNFFIIEDDYLSDLSFMENQKTSTLKSIDDKDRVIYIKSFSKILMPGLRLAFMIIPDSIYNDVLQAKHISDISTSGLIQRAFDVYLRMGLWERHIKYIEKIYTKRFETIISSIQKYIPSTLNITLPKGGLNFWFSLPDGYSTNNFYNYCLKHDVLIVPGSMFYVNQKDNNHFRVSIGSIHRDKIEYGIKRLSEIAKGYLDNYNKRNVILSPLI